MKYFYKKPDVYVPVYGETYRCNHEFYNRCTLYEQDGKGIAVVQKRFKNKKVYWTEIDPWLRNDIYLNPKFPQIFENMANKPDEYGIYPTISVRKLMWALRMKPMKKQTWETQINQLL